MEIEKYQKVVIIKNVFYICKPKKGKVQEWLNWPAWKASKRQKRFRGSNPLLSALATTDIKSVVFLLVVGL